MLIHSYTHGIITMLSTRINDRKGLIHTVTHHNMHILKSFVAAWFDRYTSTVDGRKYTEYSSYKFSKR